MTGVEVLDGKALPSADLREVRDVFARLACAKGRWTPRWHRTATPSTMTAASITALAEQQGLGEIAALSSCGFRESWPATGGRLLRWLVASRPVTSQAVRAYRNAPNILAAPSATGASIAPRTARSPR
jgi:hypothetical protein